MNVRDLLLERLKRAALLVLLLCAVGLGESLAQEIGLPTVTTIAVAKSSNNVVSGGNVVNDGGSPVTARGICYGNNSNPDLSASFTHTEDGTGTGVFSSVIDASATGTIYVRAYATNAYGTAYGDQVTVNIDYLNLPRFQFNEHTYIVAPDPTPYNEYISWPSANAYCENLTAYGYSDWRMPTIEELEMMYLYRSSIGGFVDGYYPLNTWGVYELYHSSSYDSEGLYHLQVKWWNGSRVSRQEYNDYGRYLRPNSNNIYDFCHVRPIRVETITPIVTTSNVSDITPMSAICGGTVTDEGSCTVTARGVCWSTSPNPTTNSNHTNNGAGTGNFTINITGLNPGTLYYVRSYATNCEGTSYGSEVSFTTSTISITTNEVTCITQTSATCGGYVTAYNGTIVTDRGVCWSTTNQTPTVSDNHTSSGTGTGSFTSNLTGLTQNTTYYVRAYAICSGGTAYGETMQFKTTKFEYRISDGGVVATSAGGYFYDSGGPNYDYHDNEHYVITFTSNQGAGTKIQMTFEYFYLGYSDDYLVIYDGMNTSDPVIGTYTRGNFPGTVTATNSYGALTFVFISDNTSTLNGWKAAISIVTPDYLIDVSANPSYGGTVSGGGYFDYGESCTLTATANNGYTFANWTENGNVVSTNPYYSFTVNGNRNLVANFVETSANTCNLVFELMDFYGDGWNGNQLVVEFSDGTPTENLTFTSGYTANYTMEIGNGVHVALRWVTGSYTNECSFKVKYEVGPQIYQGSSLNSNFSYSFQMDCSSSDSPIIFADANVKALCLTNWDTNGDGELSYTEASTVTDLGSVFSNKSNIISFNELQYFYGVSSIGANAFKSCNSLNSITLPNSLSSIGNNAFFGCSSLASIVIPQSVISIGSEVFRDCPGLTQMKVNGNNTVYDSRSNCNGIIETATNKLIYGCKNTVIPNSVTSIGGAFDGCSSLTSITIPNAVTSIGDYAFYGCSSLASMNILADNPPTLGTLVFRSVNKSIPVYVPCGTIDVYTIANGWYEFANFQLEEGCSISFADANVKALCVANWDTNGDGELSYAEAAAVTYLGEVFKYNENINSFNELKHFVNLTSIGSSAFYFCRHLTSVEIPNSVTSIGDGAFYGTDLSSIEIPNSVTSIGDGAFNSTNLSSIHLPNSLISMGKNVFGNCHTLTSVEIPSSVTYIGIGLFSNCSSLVQIVVDTNNLVYDSRNNCNAIIKTASNELIAGCKNTVIPNTVTSIGHEAFSFCLGLTSIDIPNSVTTIRSTAFFFCLGLASIDIPNSVSTIEIAAFFRCNLTQISVEAGNMFYDSRNDSNAIIETATNTLVIGCKTTTIPSSVTSIGDYAFYCSGLASVDIPNSVTSIGESAFDGCSGLTSITSYATTPPTLGTDVFKDVPTTATVYVPCASLEAYQNAAWGGFSNFVGMCPYEVTATANPVAGGTVTGGGTFDAGILCTLTATPNVGYTFGSWTENGVTVSTDATYSFTVSGDRTLVANFAPEGNYWTPENTGNYSLTMALTGVIEIDGVEQFSDQLEVGAFCNGVCRGSQMASEFYLTNRYLVMLSIHGEIGDELTFKLYDHGLAQELNLTSPDAVTFTIDGYGTPIEPYPLNFISSYEILATIDPEGAGTIVGTGSYVAGSSCTLVAEANDGYQFVNWTLDGVEVSTNATFEFTVTQSAAYVAHFNSVQTQTLAQGWNWWSTYIGQNGSDGLTMLENSLGSNGIRIQSKNNGYVDQFEYNGTSYWYGTLNALTNEQMYMVRTNTPCDATMTGQANVLADHPITINNGWNWIGFPGSESVSVANAMSGFAPEANDQIKSKNNGYSTYVVYGSNALWYGTLNTLEPGQGYMYKSNSGETKTLVYQDGRGETRANVTTEGNMFQPNEADYAHNMTITAIVELGGDELRSDSYELAVFAGNECRGSAKLMYSELLDRYIAFLLVAGEAEENLRFVLTDGRNARWSDDEMKFTIDGVVGSPIEPAIIHFGTLGVEENDGDNIIVYPNPSKNVFNIEGEGLRKVEIVNAYGQLIFTKEIACDYLQIDLGNRSAGVYMLRVVTEKGIKTQQIIKNN